MSYRIMRIMCFYDLPSVSARDRKDYRLFRKFLLKDGFIMMQESVYSKIVLNRTMADLAVERIKQKLPSDGLIQVLTVTEKQYAGIQCLLGDGDKNTNVVHSTDRLVIF